MSEHAPRQPIGARLPVWRMRATLVAWLLAVVGITYIQDPLWLAGMLAGLVGVVLLAEARAGVALLWRIGGVLLLLNGSVGLGYVVLAEWHGDPWAMVLGRLNLRVALLTLLTLWLVRRLDLARATAGWPALHYLVVLTQGQIRTFSRLMAEFDAAWRSRTPAAGRGDRLRAAGARGAALWRRAEARSRQVTEAMRARGAFDDRPEPDARRERGR